MLTKILPQIIAYTCEGEGIETRDVEAEAGSGPFSVEAEAEARKFYRFHIDYLT